MAQFKRCACQLGRPQPIRLLVQIPATPFLIQNSLLVFLRTGGWWVKSLSPCHPHANPDGIPGSWLKPGLTKPGSCSHWGNEPTNRSCLSHSPTPTFKLRYTFIQNWFSK